MPQITRREWVKGMALAALGTVAFHDAKSMLNLAEDSFENL